MLLKMIYVILQDGVPGYMGHRIYFTRFPVETILSSIITACDYVNPLIILNDDIIGTK